MNPYQLLSRNLHPIAAPPFRPCRATVGSFETDAPELPADGRAGLVAEASGVIEERPCYSPADWRRDENTTRRHSIVLADDHPVVRQSLKKLLNQQEDFDLVGESDNGLEALSLVKQYQPDLLVTDLMMPGMNGLEVTRRIRLSFPATRIVVVSVNGDEPYVAGAFRCGANAFVLKTVCGRHLIPAVRAVLAGRRYVSPPLSEPLL